MVKMVLKTSLVVFGFFLQIGCDGGDNTPSLQESQTTAIKGKVIDGYVSGATVWLDINGNGVQDNFEPSTVSGAAGDYELELTDDQRQCLAYSTLYVDVPVGAVDESEGEVTEAYKMAFPPQMQAIDDDRLFNISPLTTLIWEQITLEEQSVASCQDLLDDVEERESLASAISVATEAMVRVYNISAEKIYSDFIAAEDEETQALAVEFVKGFKASLQFSLELEETFVDSYFNRVVYYTSNSVEQGNEQHWYREYSLWFDDGDYIYKQERLSDDLSTVDYVLYDRKTTIKPWQQGEFVSGRDIIYSDIDEVIYRCSKSESITATLNDITYRFSNDSVETESPSYDGCVFEDFIDSERRSFEVSYTDDGATFITRFDQNAENGAYPDLVEWVNFEDKEESLNFEEVEAYLANTGFRFEEDTTAFDWFYWYKSKVFSEGDNTIRIVYDIYGEWERVTTFADNTSQTECSTDGENWGECTE